MRGLQPSSIYLSEDLKQVEFTDLLSITRKYDAAPHGVTSDSPYNIIDEYREHVWIRNNHYLDIHALGTIILEILTGTEVVLCCNNWEAVYAVVRDCKDHIDEEIYELLHILIYLGNDNTLQAFVEEVLDKTPETIAMNIRAMDFAVQDVRVLQERREGFTNYMERNLFTAMDRWGVEPELIDWSNPPILVDSQVNSDEES